MRRVANLETLSAMCQQHLVKKAQEILNGLAGQICWGPSYDSQLNLSVNFGEPHLRIREARPDSSSEVLRGRGVRVAGEWWLWIYVARWKLTIGDSQVTGRSSRKKMNQALARLEGQKLANAEVDLDTGATKLDFDLGAELLIRRWNRDDDDDLWILYEPNGWALSVTAQGHVERQPTNQSRGVEAGAGKEAHGT